MESTRQLPFGETRKAQTVGPYSMKANDLGCPFSAPAVLMELQLNGPARLDAEKSPPVVRFSIRT